MSVFETIPLPTHLWRGDSDPLRKRRLRETLGTGVVSTNLGARGDGREIFRRPLEDLVLEHVGGVWKMTHFLSFSKDPAVALRYAAGGDREIVRCPAGEAWDAAVLRLDLGRLTSHRQIMPGVFLATYRRNFFSQHAGGDLESWLSQALRLTSATRENWPGETTVCLVDVEAVLRHRHPAMEEEIAAAGRDQEWLVLPVDAPAHLRGEHSCLLDDSLIGEVVYLSFVEVKEGAY